MKTEAEIREVIEMLDDIMPNMPHQTGSEMSMIRDALIEKHKKRKANRN